MKIFNQTLNIVAKSGRPKIALSSFMAFLSQYT